MQASTFPAAASGKRTHWSWDALPTSGSMNRACLAGRRAGGMAAFLEADCDALYSGAQAKKKIWFEFMIEGKTSSLTNFVITYKND